MKQKIYFRETELKIFNDRAKQINDVVGCFAFGLALAAISTEAPWFYALLSLVFIFTLLNRVNSRYEGIFKMWREVNHAFIKPSAWRHYAIFLFGYTF